METICRRHPVFTWLVCYQDGRIWNEKSQRWLKGALKSGHFRTDLQIEGKRYQPLIHTLIFEAFNGTYEKNKYDVHHINGIPTDNRLENLKLLTKSEHHKLHSNTKEWKERVSKLGKRTIHIAMEHRKRKVA